jgi:hypothetical protein
MRNLRIPYCYYMKTYRVMTSNAESLHGWIKELIENKKKLPSEKKQLEEKGCMEAHTDLLHLEANFQVSLVD